MKFAIVASAIAAIAPLASAAGYNAAWTITGAACDGQIKLGEYTANTTCAPVDCKPIEGVSNVSTKTTCVDSHITGANEVLKANPYVLVEVYKADSNCTGDFAIAIGVTADGTCIPGTNGKASYNVTWSAEKGAVWLQYTDGKCSSEVTTVPFPPAATDGKTCTAGFLKALAVAPSSSSGTEAGSGMGSGMGMTTAPAAGSTSAPASSSNSSSANASTPAPATTTSAASSTMVGVAAAAVLAVATATLA